MKSTTITDLRTHLSRYLDAVRSGQTIEVRDRKVPIARIVPITAATDAAKGDLPPWVERLRRSGGARIGSLKPVKLRPLPKGPMDTGVVDALLEERRTGR
jgi:prevent-host-death family protein